MLRLLALVAVLLVAFGVLAVIWQRNRADAANRRGERTSSFLPKSPVQWVVLAVVAIFAVWFLGGMIAAGT